MRAASSCPRASCGTATSRWPATSAPAAPRARRDTSRRAASPVVCCSSVRSAVNGSSCPSARTSCRSMARQARRASSPPAWLRQSLEQRLERRQRQGRGHADRARDQVGARGEIAYVGRQVARDGAGRVVQARVEVRGRGQVRHRVAHAGLVAALLAAPAARPTACRCPGRPAPSARPSTRCSPARARAPSGTGRSRAHRAADPTTPPPAAPRPRWRRPRCACRRR